MSHYYIHIHHLKILLIFHTNYNDFDYPSPCFLVVSIKLNAFVFTWGDPKKTRLVSMPPNTEKWDKDVSACSLDPQLSVAKRTSSCNNSISRTVSFHEGSFCDPVEIVMCDLKEQRTCLKFCFLLGKTPTES